MVAAGVWLLVRDGFARWQRNRRRSARYAGRWWIQDVIETAALYMVGAAVGTLVLSQFLTLIK